MEKKQCLVSSGSRSCPGCGQALASRAVLEASGPDTIISNATGCLEVTTTPYPESAWGVPWVHSLFENAPAVASGIRASLDAQGKQDTHVIAQGGDGSTFDIGFGLLSGMWNRHEDILYVCYDNEAYMNTGYQNSGSTALGAITSTAPTGNLQKKKNLPAIAVAHGVPYVATASAHDVLDIKRKVAKAFEIKGPKYIQILSPCIPGWKTKPEDTVDVAKLAVETAIYPSYEIINGKLTQAVLRRDDHPKVEEYLKMQRRFAHLFKSEEGGEIIKKLQEYADENDAKLRHDLKNG